ncbi:4-hydroxy-2-oxoheptanedioate aldolase [soil metagenome]
MRGDRPRFGMWAATGSSYVTEIVAGSGIDWLLVDQEHAPNDISSTLAQLQALAGYPDVDVVVRPPSADPVGIKRLLDIGVTNLMVPMIDTPEQAAAAVAATRYPPAGIRGVGAALARASAWNRISDYIVTAEDGISLTVQVETVAALQVLPEICAVSGVAGVFIGPADLAASMGRLGKPEDDDVVEVIEQALETISAAGLGAGVNAFNETIARRYLGAGAGFVLVGADATLVARGAEQLVNRYRS